MVKSEEIGAATTAIVDTPDRNPVDGDDMAAASSKSTKSPAYQFYPEAWFSSSKVRRMSYTEKGMYTDLLAYCWLENGLPTDVKVLAKMLGVPSSRFARIWQNGSLHECFFERNGRLFNARQERERKKQAEFRRSKQDAAHMRWSHRRDADAMLSISISDPVSISKKKNKEEDTTPTVLTFPVTGDPEHPTWALTQGRIDGWRAAFPQLNVELECRKALAWVEANGPKTGRGMPAFLVRWFNNAVNRGPRAVLAPTGTEGRGRTGAPPPGKYAGLEEQD